MILVYKFASGSCDDTNIWGHAAIAFTGLPDKKKCFAISQMKSPGSDPTWQNFKDQGTRRWRRSFFASRTGHAFPRVLDKAYILSNEALSRLHVDPPSGGGLSEVQAYQWWKGVMRSTPDMSNALDSSDCSDTVFAAIRASLVNQTSYAWARTPLRPFQTPQATVDYARAINSEIKKRTGVTEEQAQELLRLDKMWWNGVLPEVVDPSSGESDGVPLLV